MTASNIASPSQPSVSPITCVYIVEPDGLFRQDFQQLLCSVALEVRTFAEPTSFLNTVRWNSRGCVVMDVCLPGMTGLQLQHVLHQRGVHLPLIMLTSDPDLRTAVEALKRGAFDFLEKGCSRQLLLERVFQAIELDASRSVREQQAAAIRERLNLLTRRERQIVELLMQGRTTKQAAMELELSAKTVENHRARIMEKMQAETFAMLVHQVWQGADGDLSNLDRHWRPAPWNANSALEPVHA